jgi:hypothetical protein
MFQVENRWTDFDMTFEDISLLELNISVMNTRLFEVEALQAPLNIGS